MTTAQKELSITSPDSMTARPELVGQLIERPANLGVLALGGPGAVLEKASEIATQLARIIDDKKLFVAIKGKRFVYCEGWTTLGAMLGVTCKEVATVESTTKPGEFIATVEAIRTSDGAVIGGASASCGPDEKDWSSRSRQARRSMAQTRAAGKAMRILFSWVMNLAGYEVCPFEEIEGTLAPTEYDNPAPNQGAPKAAPRNERVTAEQINQLREMWLAYIHPEGTREQFATYCRGVCQTTALLEKMSAWEQWQVTMVREALEAAGR
jgi:hypothetical protein